MSLGLPLLTSSLLTKIGIIYTQRLAGGKDLSNNTQIRVLSVMAPEDMHKKLSKKLGAKFPAITRGYSMVKFSYLDGAFFEVFLTTGKIKKIQKPNLERRRSLSGLKILISMHAKMS